MTIKLCTSQLTIHDNGMLELWNETTETWFYGIKSNPISNLIIKSEKFGNLLFHFIIFFIILVSAWLQWNVKSIESLSKIIYWIKF